MDNLNELMRELDEFFGETVLTVVSNPQGIFIEADDEGLNVLDSGVMLTPGILVKMHRAAKLARNVEGEE